MKRFLHAGEDYAQNSLANRQKLHLTRDTNNPACLKFGWLAYPSWVPRVTGIQFLVALFCFLPIDQVFGQERFEFDSSNQFAIPEGGVVIGDMVPDWFWELGFHTISHPKGQKSVSLIDYRDKLLVIDFWATWCKPCVESIDKWEVLHKEFPNEVAVLAVHAFDAEEKAAPFVDQKGWSVPVIAGAADSLINRLFYTHYRFGQIWIKDNKLIAIPLSKSVTRNNIIRVIRNLPHQIEMNPVLTYFDPRYQLDEGRNDERN